MADEDNDRLEAELARLRGSLSQVRRVPSEGEAPSQGRSAPAPDSGLSMGLRAASEFVSAIVVGAAIGWGLDWLLGTRPLFIILFFMIGVAAGVWNVIRLTSPKRGPKSGD